MGTGWAAGGAPVGRRRLGEVLVAGALSDQLGLPFLDLGSMPIPDETLAVLPRNVALRHGAVPVTLAHDVLTVALADPTNVLALDDIRLATKLASVRTAVATASDVQEAVNRYFGGAAAGGVGDVDDAPVLRLVNAIMGEALHSRASDIHIDPRSATSASATASTGSCARSRWFPSRSRGR
jgi:type IV pilus assembly protein PilB